MAASIRVPEEIERRLDALPQKFDAPKRSTFAKWVSATPLATHSRKCYSIAPPGQFAAHGSLLASVCALHRLARTD